MRHLKFSHVPVSSAYLCERRRKAVRKIRIARGHGQVVLDPPCDFDRRELALVRRIAIVFGMVHQRKAPARIDSTHAARAMKALGLRFPFLHPDLRQVVAARLIQIRVGAGVLVHLELIGQLALAAHRRQRRALRIRRLRRILVVERTRRARHALQRARARPLCKGIGLACRTAAIETHGLRRQRRKRLQVIGDHERMRLAVVGLLPRAIEPLVLHQPMHEIPVRFTLPRERSVQQRLRQSKAKSPSRFRMHTQHIGNDLLRVPVDPDLLVPAKPKQMHPRAQLQLIGSESAARSKTPNGVHVAVDWPVGFVRLLDPQRRRLGDQFLEFEVIIARYDVKRERVIPSDARSAYCTLYRKQICAQRRV
ncbi:hypothetical protein IST455A_02678 [Burkholderia multivorans]|nr:hypothetical protein IST455A_02678 [Burkholderia multivorans]